MWSHSDTKDGITVARARFGRSSRGHAVIKIEGTLPADPTNVFHFLRLSTKDGGKVRKSMLKYDKFYIIYITFSWTTCSGMNYWWKNYQVYHIIIIIINKCIYMSAVSHIHCTLLLSVD